MQHKIGRRQFLGGALAAAGAFAVIPARSSGAAGSKIEILLDEPIGSISPNIYGHFVEHLGAVVYDGIWVGERSKIPNIHGIRTSLVDALKRIKAPVIRYPGGCFAEVTTGERHRRTPRVRDGTNFGMEPPATKYRRIRQRVSNRMNSAPQSS